MKKYFKFNKLVALLAMFSPFLASAQFEGPDPSPAHAGEQVQFTNSVTSGHQFL